MGPMPLIAPHGTHLDGSLVTHGALANEVDRGHGAGWLFPMSPIGAKCVPWDGSHGAIDAWGGTVMAHGPPSGEPHGPL